MFWSFQKKKSYTHEAVTTHFPLPTPRPYKPYNLLSASIDLPILDISYKWNDTRNGLLCLASFIKHNVCKMYPSISTFLWLNNIPLYGYTTFVYPLSGCWTFVKLGLGVCEPASRTPHHNLWNSIKKRHQRKTENLEGKKETCSCFLLISCSFPAPSYQHLSTSAAVFLVLGEAEFNWIQFTGLFFF